MSIDPFDQKILDLFNGPFNHRATHEAQACFNADGAPIPWYTYPAIEYLDELDVSEKTIFEYGSGHSSLYWASRGKYVVSVEHSLEWHGKFKGDSEENQELLLRPEPEPYVKELEQHGLFDIIVIDGAWRAECAALAHNNLNDGGVIILDNSDWYVKAGQRLRNDGLLQVDMKGLGPINPYAWCTSFFFDRKFDFPKRHVYQPTHGLGARELFAEEEWPDGCPNPETFRRD